MAQTKIKNEVGPAKKVRSSPQEAENWRQSGEESQEERERNTVHTQLRVGKRKQATVKPCFSKGRQILNRMLRAAGRCRQWEEPQEGEALGRDFVQKETQRRVSPWKQPTQIVCGPHQCNHTAGFEGCHVVGSVYPFWVTSERNLEARSELVWLHPKEHLSDRALHAEERWPPVLEDVLRLLWGLPAQNVWVATSLETQGKALFTSKSPKFLHV